MKESSLILWAFGLGCAIFGGVLTWVCIPQRWRAEAQERPEDLEDDDERATYEYIGDFLIEYLPGEEKPYHVESRRANVPYVYCLPSREEALRYIVWAAGDTPGENS